MKPVDEMTREEMEAEVMWNYGGMDAGSMGDSMIWAMDRPTSEKLDLRSIVAVTGPSAKYEDAELRRILKMARIVTARYDTMFQFRRGANLVCIDKGEWLGKITWWRKRLSWTQGSMWSRTLDHACVIFERDVGEEIPKHIQEVEDNALP